MKLTFTFLIAVILTISTFAQTYKTVTLIEQRNHYLNGGFNSSVGGQSRVVIKIDLPEHTQKWYYSFTTSPGESGTKVLNLGLQIGAAVATSGASALASSQINVPPGSGAAEIFVIDTKYRDAFLSKDDQNWRYFADVSVEKSKQAVQSVDASYGNSVYLGLRNPSTWDGINIFIEVVAVVEEGNAEEDKGTFYGSLGWKAYERKELDKCVEYSMKALTFNPNLTWVKFNIALVHLAQNNGNCIDEYISALTMIRKDKNPKGTLTGALQDIEDLENKYNYSNLEYLTDVKELLQNEYRKY